MTSLVYQYDFHLDGQNHGRQRKESDPASLIIDIPETEATREGVNEIRYFVESVLEQQVQLEVIEPDDTDFNKRRARRERWKKVDYPHRFTGEIKSRIASVLEKHNLHMEERDSEIRIDRTEDPWVAYLKRVSKK